MSRRSLQRWSARLCLAFCCAPACEPVPPPAQGLVREARLGVFYGGQIQEREEVPMVLDQSRQSQGFRLEFERPLGKPVSIRWEIEMPGAGRGGPLHLSKLGELTAQPGQQRIDQLFAFEPGDPLGLWNLRVHVEDELVIDRAWWVFDPAARRRALDD